MIYFNWLHFKSTLKSQTTILIFWHNSREVKKGNDKYVTKAAIVTNPAVGGNGFITYQGTPLGIPHQGLQTEAYLCAQLSTGAQRCHTAPVTTPLACLKRQDDIYKSYPK